MAARSAGRWLAVVAVLECAVVYLALLGGANYAMEMSVVAHIPPPSVRGVTCPPLRSLAAALVVAVTLALSWRFAARAWLAVVLGALCPLVGDLAAAPLRPEEVGSARDAHLLALPLAGLGTALWWLFRRSTPADDAPVAGSVTALDRLRLTLVALVALPALASPWPFVWLPDHWLPLRPPLSWALAACSRPLLWATAASVLAVRPLTPREPARLSRFVTLMVVLLAWALGLLSYEWLQRSY